MKTKLSIRSGDLATINSLSRDYQELKKMIALSLNLEHTALDNIENKCLIQKKSS